jgi:hypothetical protein
MTEHSWREEYRAAILETNNLEMVSRIRSAQSALEKRLGNGVEAGSDEHHELLNAQDGLQSLIDERT